MIEIDYRISPGWKHSWGAKNLGKASESDLLYRTFLGDVVFKIDITDFSAAWGWIPIIHFAASLGQILREIEERDGAETTFEFTESDATIHFKRQGDVVIVSTSFASGSPSVTLSEFNSAVEVFLHRVAQELPDHYPPLKDNENFTQLLSKHAI